VYCVEVRKTKKTHFFSLSLNVAPPLLPYVQNSIQPGHFLHHFARLHVFLCLISPGFSFSIRTHRHEKVEFNEGRGGNSSESECRLKEAEARCVCIQQQRYG